jgi:hypothetical protein
MAPPRPISQSAGTRISGVSGGDSGAGTELRVVDGGEGDGAAVKSEKLSGEGPLRDLFTALHLGKIGRIASDLLRDLGKPEPARAAHLRHEESISHAAEHGAPRRSLQPSLPGLRRRSRCGIWRNVPKSTPPVPPP